QKRPRRQDVVERLLADPVASENEPACSPVPECECKHAAQPGDDLRPPGVPAVDDDLGIAAAAKGITELLEVAADLSEVVDFPVIANPDVPIRTCHRLVSGRRQVDDGKPRM